MKVDVQDFLKSNGKLLPQSIQSHEAFKSEKTITKILPMLGLSNHSSRFPANFDGVNYKLVVSSDPWDIATMSMRGVMSCMHWENQHHTHLVGSIFDPCLSMIYLTDGERTPYGESIIKRALVRLTFPTNDPQQHSRYYPKNCVFTKPIIFIERPYTKTDNTNPVVYKNRESPNLLHTIRDIFLSYLKKNTKYNVVDSYSIINGMVFIPHTKVLNKFSSYYASMSDSGLGYHETVVSKSFISSVGVQ